MLGSFYGGDVAGKAMERRAEVTSRLSVDPPESLVARSLILVTLWLNPFINPLVNLGEF